MGEDDKLARIFLNKAAKRILNALNLNQMSLKQRILMIFAASTLIPFFCTAYLSYNAMSTILADNLDSSVRSNLQQVLMSLENTISNLNHVSQQLVFQGSAGKKLEELLSAQHQYDRLQLIDEIKTELNLITFTNPGIGLTTYYFENENKFWFNNFGVKDDFSVEKLPLLAQYYEITYYGPHISNRMFSKEYVLSALRHVDLPGRDDIYVYIESGFNLTQNILESDHIGTNSYHLVLDNDGRIAYSEVPSLFPVNTRFEPAKNGKDYGLMKDHYWFKGTSNQGWSVVSLIPQAKYNKERSQWVMQMFFLSLLFITISLLIAWFLWKMLYKPIHRFSQEIKWVENNDFHPDPEKTYVPEFDLLLERFQNMKKQIIELFEEMKIKEKRRADLEIEKLLYQINPHFLRNTLDTVHWLAVMNGQKEIDRLVLSLNKLLYYNLGKLGKISTVREEIDSLRQYLILQQIRYDFDFDVRIEADDNVMNVPLPRFILQPLVENALYHGLNDEGHIDVKVMKEEEYVVIWIRDNGSGISQEEIKRLLEQQLPEKKKVGMGIGINYVKRMLESFYEGKAKMEITSGNGSGTTVCLRFPIMDEVEEIC